MRRTSATNPLVLASCLFTMPGAALAELSTITLEHPVAPWDETGVANVHVFGCAGPVLDPQRRSTPAGPVIDIDVENCVDAPVDPLPSVDAVVALPNLWPADYTVLLQDARRHGMAQPPPPLAEAALATYRHGDMGAKLAAPAVSTENVLLDIRWLEVGCHDWGPPVVDGNVVEAHYIPECLIIPLAGAAERTFDLGVLDPGRYEVRLFDHTGVGSTTDRPGLDLFSFEVTDPVVDPCPDPTALCLGDGRFEVHADWVDFAGRRGVGMPIHLAEGADSGLFWFFWDDAVELTVKVLDGCNLTGHYWVFVSSATSVAFEVTVTDTVGGATWSIAQPLRTLAPLVADTHALPCD